MENASSQTDSIDAIVPVTDLLIRVGMALTILLSLNVQKSKRGCGVRDKGKTRKGPKS